MKKTLLNLLVIAFSICLYACNSDNAGSGGKKSNQELNDELQEEHYQLVKEHQKWVDEHRLFGSYIDTLKTIYDVKRIEHEPGYDEIIEKLTKLMFEHGDIIEKHVKVMDEHTANLEQHEQNKIDDRQAQDNHRAFYAKHKAIEKKHDELIDTYEDLIKKLGFFITNAGGTVPPMPKMEANKGAKEEEKKETGSKDAEPATK